MTAPASPPVAVGGDDLLSTDMVAVPRWVFADFLNNQPGWPDTARRYLNAPALASPVSGDGSSADADTHRAAAGAVVAALQDLLVAVTFDAPARKFAGVLAYEARIPVEFVERADAALGLSRAQPQPAASRSPGMETLQASECTKHGEGDQ